MPIIRRTAQAEEDLIDIWLYIAPDNLAAADRLLDEIEAKMSLLADQPQLGPARPDIAEDCRYFPVGNYLILYRIISAGIEVVLVVRVPAVWRTSFPEPERSGTFCSKSVSQMPGRVHALVEHAEDKNPCIRHLVIDGMAFMLIAA